MSTRALAISCLTSDLPDHALTQPCARALTGAGAIDVVLFIFGSCEVYERSTRARAREKVYAIEPPECNRRSLLPLQESPVVPVEHHMTAHDPERQADGCEPEIYSGGSVGFSGARLRRIPNTLGLGPVASVAPTSFGSRLSAPGTTATGSARALPASTD